eukprot:gene3137-937_t
MHHLAAWPHGAYIRRGVDVFERESGCAAGEPPSAAACLFAENNTFNPNTMQHFAENFFPCWSFWSRRPALPRLLVVGAGRWALDALAEMAANATAGGGGGFSAWIAGMIRAVGAGVARRLPARRCVAVYGRTEQRQWGWARGGPRRRWRDDLVRWFERDGDAASLRDALLGAAAGAPAAAGAAGGARRVGILTRRANRRLAGTEGLRAAAAAALPAASASKHGN